jgi:hypothetical protein
MSKRVQRGHGLKVRFPGMAPASKGRKSSGGFWPPEPAPLARRRPGYSSSGCTPAEPDSASPGTTKLACHCCLSIMLIRRTERPNISLTQGDSSHE